MRLSAACCTARWWGSFLLALWAVLASPALEIANAAGPLVTASGPQGDRELISVTDNVARFDAQSTSSSVKLSDLVRFGQLTEPRNRSALVLLVGGGRIVSRIENITPDAVQVYSSLLGELKIPRSAVTALLLRPSSETARRDDVVRRLRQGSSTQDTVWLRNGDQLVGQIHALKMPAKAAAEGPTQVLALNIKSVEVPIDFETVEAVQFGNSPARPEATGLATWVGFSDGTLLLTQNLSISADGVEFRPAGVRLPRSETWQGRAGSVTFLQPMGGNVRYLSNETPSGFRNVPFLDLDWKPAFDSNVLGLPLRVGGKTFLKGIGLHPSSVLVYSLTPGASRFEAELAVDDAAGTAGSVVFHVLVDGQNRFTSPIRRGGEAPLPISVDLSGGQKTLTLLVTPADRGPVCDYADWLDARLVP